MNHDIIGDIHGHADQLEGLLAYGGVTGVREGKVEAGFHIPNTPAHAI